MPVPSVIKTFYHAYPLEFEQANGIPEGVLSQKYSLPNGFHEEALESALLGTELNIAKIYVEIMRLNPELKQAVERRVITPEKYQFDILRGVCTRINIEDIIYYLRRNGDKDESKAKRDLMRHKQLEKEFDVKLYWFLSPETEQQLRAIMHDKRSQHPIVSFLVRLSAIYFSEAIPVSEPSTRDESIPIQRGN